MLMMIIYQFSLNLTCLIISLKIGKYRYKKSLYFALLFIVIKINYIFLKNFVLSNCLVNEIKSKVNHIFDRYPNENHYTISILLLIQHSDIISKKVQVFSLSVSNSYYDIY